MSARTKFYKPNSPPVSEPWIWMTKAMLESPAWRALPPFAVQVIVRVMIEHMNHAGTMNGELTVTYDDFAKFGVRRQSVSIGVAVAEALGFIDVVDRGTRSYGVVRRPSTYALTWLGRHDHKPASNRWNLITADNYAAALVDQILASGKPKKKSLAIGAIVTPLPAARRTHNITGDP